MVTLLKELSTKLKEGKAQILIRATLSRTNRPRFKTGIYVAPSFFERGTFIFPKKYHNSIDEAEALLAKEELNSFCTILNALIDCASTHMKDVSKEFLVTALEAYHRGVLPYNGHSFRFEDLQKILFPLEVLANVQHKRKNLELPAVKKSFYELVKDYCKSRSLNKTRYNSYMISARLLYRFEQYQQLIEGRKGYFFDYETATNEDILLIRDYVIREHTICKNFPDKYALITERMNNQFPMNHFHERDFQYAERSENYAISILIKMNTVMAWIRNELRLTQNDPFKGVIIGTEQVQAHPIFITIEERNRLADVDIPDERLAAQRDIFIFQCLVGCRYGDLIMLKEENINNGILEYLAEKTKNNVNPAQPRIPLAKRALALVEKYRGKDPYGRLFPFTSMNPYNKAIKSFLKIAGIDRIVYVLDPKQKKEVPKRLYEVGSSHMARRTFVGNIYNKVKDPNIICTMSGHVQGSKAFARYRDINDETRREVIDQIQ